MIMTEQLKQYFANWNIKHNGDRFGIGDSISLNEKDAKGLLDTGAVREPIEGDVKINSSGANELTDEQKFQKVYAAIGGLDKENKDNWIQNGAPDCNVLSDVVEFDVSSGLRYHVWNKFLADSQSE
jgi:hypothetical protein